MERESYKEICLIIIIKCTNVRALNMFLIGRRVGGGATLLSVPEHEEFSSYLASRRRSKVSYFQKVELFVDKQGLLLNFI
jgi:hypothetical protein